MALSRRVDLRSTPIELCLDLLQRAAADVEIVVGLDDIGGLAGLQSAGQEENGEQGASHYIASAPTLR